MKKLLCALLAATFLATPALAVPPAEQAPGLNINSSLGTSKTIVLSGTGNPSLSNSYQSYSGFITGTASGSPSAFNWAVNDQIASSYSSIFSISSSVGGGTTSGYKTVLQTTLGVNAAVSAANSGNYVSFYPQAYGSANVGGTGGSIGNYYGGLWGSNPNVWLASGATNWRSIYGQEIDVGVWTGASVAQKYGLAVILDLADAVQGSFTDVGIEVAAQSNTTPGFKCAVCIGDAAADWPVASTGTIFGAVTRSLGGTSPPVATYGIDLSGVAFQPGGFAFRSSGFSVDPSGNVIAAGFSSPYTHLSGNATLTIGRSYDVDTTAARSLSLPALSSVTAGQSIRIADATGTASINPITITAAGSDTFNNISGPINFEGNFRSIVFIAGPASAYWEVSY